MNYSILWFKKIVSLFPTVKLTANYEETGKVGILEIDFQQVPFFNFFRNFHNIVAKVST